MFRLTRPVDALALAAFIALAACGQPETTIAVAAHEPGEAAPAPVDETLEAGEAAAHDDDRHDDHDDHADAGGDVHVHGLADLAVTVENGKVSAQMISPLANFGAAESDGVLPDAVFAGLPGLVTLTGGDCVPETPQAAVDTSSGHAEAEINLSWTCRDAAGLSALRFDGFAAYPGFETINAVFLAGSVQKAGELSSSQPELSLK